MDANRNPRLQDTRRRKVEFLACVHCSHKLVAIYQTLSGKREFAILPGVQYSVENAMGQVICFKCPDCGHSTIASMNMPQGDPANWVWETPLFNLP